MLCARIGFAVMIVIGGACSSGVRGRGAPPPVELPSAPLSQPMAPSDAYGVWHSSFGAVRIEPLDVAVPARVHGGWLYDREGTEMLGYFEGELRGNVLDLVWQEPGYPAGQPPLRGRGFLVFAGGEFQGYWWSDARDRHGPWSGARADVQPLAAPAEAPGPAPDTSGEAGPSGTPVPAPAAP